MRKADVLLPLCACAFALNFFPTSEADARGFGFGGARSIFKGAAKALGVQPQSGGSGGGSSHRNSGGGSGSGNSGGSDDGDDNGDVGSKGLITASKNAAESRKVAKKSEELADYERSLKVEHARNVDAAIDDFLDELRKQHQDLLAGVKNSGRNFNVNTATSLQINQVTKGQISAAVDSVYDKQHLGDYDKFAGELWTRDRLKVRVLNVAETDLAPYFDGVGARGPSMDDINGLLDRSARFVYAEALELGEIIGVSHSFDRFIVTIYEQSSDNPGSLWTTGADGQYERLVSTVIDNVPRQKFVASDSTQIKDSLGLEKQFQFRFRARRAIYDCLSQNYSALASGGGKTIEIASKGVQPARSTRGASLDADANAQPAKSAAADAKIAPDAAPDAVWRHAQDYVKDVCRGPVMAVADAASKGDLKPVPARFDSSNTAPPTSAVSPASSP